MGYPSYIHHTLPSRQTTVQDIVYNLWVSQLYTSYTTFKTNHCTRYIVYNLWVSQLYTSYTTFKTNHCTRYIVYNLWVSQLYISYTTFKTNHCTRYIVYNLWVSQLYTSYTTFKTTYCTRYTVYNSGFRQMLLMLTVVDLLFWSVWQSELSERAAWGHLSPRYWCRLQKIWRKEEMFYLTIHSTHFIYGYMASDIW